MSVAHRPALALPLALALGCLAACDPENASRTPGGKSSLDVARPLAVVTAFDCVSSLPEKKGETLLGMHTGGPGGAAWNWNAGALVCSVEVALGCRAKTEVRVQAGEAEQLAAPGPTMGDRVTAIATLPASLWTAAIASGTEAYSTLRLVVRADGVCESGPRAGQSFRASDELVARVASGE